MHREPEGPDGGRPLEGVPPDQLGHPSPAEQTPWDRSVRPKDPPVKDPAFLRYVIEIIGRCEWPDGCDGRHFPRQLTAAHIVPRRMGGGSRKDTPDNVVVLCAHHHAVYDHQMGQSARNQDFIRRALSKRSPLAVTLLARFASRNAPESFPPPGV